MAVKLTKPQLELLQDIAENGGNVLPLIRRVAAKFVTPEGIETCIGDTVHNIALLSNEYHLIYQVASNHYLINDEGIDILEKCKNSPYENAPAQEPEPKKKTIVEQQNKCFRDALQLIADADPNGNNVSALIAVAVDVLKKAQEIT